MMKEAYTDIRTRRQKRRESVRPGVISSRPSGGFVPLLLDLPINGWRGHSGRARVANALIRRDQEDIHMGVLKYYLSTAKYYLSTT